MEKQKTNIRTSRQIKFRGKRIKDGEWLHGCYILNRGEHFIAPDGIQPPGATAWDFEVDPSTVGQFTGMYDAKGREIYEGDILTAENLDRSVTVVIEFRSGAFHFVDRGGGIAYFFDEFGHTAIIGNMHDNPELLKGGNQ